jgi:hypothetical protein
VRAKERKRERTRLLAEHVFDEVSDDALVCKDDLAHCRERLFAERQQQVASICLEKDVGKSAQVNARAQITRVAHKHTHQSCNLMLKHTSFAAQPLLCASL